MTPATAPTREAVNRAFWELGLRFQWDEATWTSLAAMPDMTARIKAYLEGSQPHLLAVYEPKALSALVEEFLAHPDVKRTGMEAFTSAN
jgi:hypothetical protein